MQTKIIGTIGFENHRIRCIIGIHPPERIEEQELLLDLQTQWDFSSVAARDDLSHALCYAELADFCTEFAQKGKYQMLETLACDLSRKLREHFKLFWIKVTIKKPGALPTASFAFVELEYGTKGIL